LVPAWDKQIAMIMPPFTVGSKSLSTLTAGF